MIRRAKAKDLAAMKRLWKACFPEDAAFAPFFFKELYKPKQALVFEESDGVLSSMMHLMPYSLSMLGRDEPVTYIYGVGTLPEYRRQGRSGLLMNQAFIDMHESGRSLAILIPQERWLFDYYRQFDFVTGFYLRHPSVSSDIQKRAATTADIPELMRRYGLAFCARWHMLRSEKHWAHILAEYQVFLWETNGYGVYLEEKVIEAIGEGVTVSLPLRPFGMVRVIDAQAFGDVLPLSHWQVKDARCPWNESVGLREATAQEMATKLFENSNAYMNLMHN